MTSGQSRRPGLDTEVHDGQTNDLLEGDPARGHVCSQQGGVVTDASLAEMEMGPSHCATPGRMPVIGKDLHLVPVHQLVRVRVDAHLPRAAGARILHDSVVESDDEADVRSSKWNRKAAGQGGDVRAPRRVVATPDVEHSVGDAGDCPLQGTDEGLDR